MKTLIIPDIHGHYETLWGLLHEAGVLDDNDQRVEGWRVIQLGDLAECGRKNVDDDIACLKAVHGSVGPWIDTMLVGNHEHPYWGGPSFGGYNGGFQENPDVRRELNRIEREGHLAPAALVESAEGDILVTHAGFVPSEGIESAVDGFNFATEKWLEDKTHPLFSQIGTERGGWSQFGGILWADWKEPKAEEFNQILGHTPQKQGVQKRVHEDGKWALCIDIGAKSGKGASGVVVNDEGELSFVETAMSRNHL